jgi:uncharacterized membrane protein
MENYPATGKSAIGLDANLTAALGYPVGILGLISFFIEKESKFVKFHGIQSVLFSVAIWVVFIVICIVLGIISFVLSMISTALGSIFGLLFSLAGLVFFLIWFGFLLYSGYRAYQGLTFKLPLVGNYAEKLADK